MGDRLLVIDEGTTSTRAMLFSGDGRCLGSEQRELTQSYPGPGLVEHDAEEIWELSLFCARAMVSKAGGADRIAGIGITNQRETIVFWSRSTGKAIAPAIVWQDRRTASLCTRLKEDGHEPAVQARTGLLLDPYFSATKVAWALENWPSLKDAGDDLMVGTVESWLVYRLTGGLHISDATNASRTALMDIGSGHWDAGMLDLWGVPTGALPEIVDCAGAFGHTSIEHFGAPIPITGMAGDQQAASIGQACLAPGATKATYGTGAFILAHAGSQQPASGHRLLTTVACQLGGVRSYALEGSVFVAGSLVKWLRDELGLLASAQESESLARSVADSGGVYLVPALSGLGAPHWQPSARAAISGLSFSTGKAHIVLALIAVQLPADHRLTGLCALVRLLSVERHVRFNRSCPEPFPSRGVVPSSKGAPDPGFIETTALGAAMLGGVGCGMFGSLEEAALMRGPVQRFEPRMDEDDRRLRLAGWAKAVAAVLEATRS